MQSKFLIVFSYFIYIFISFFLALWTAGGWHGVGVVVLYPLVSIVPLLLFIILCLIWNHKKQTFKFSGHLKMYIFVIVVTQLLALLFNLGDCGDATGIGPYNFIQRLTQPHMFESYGRCVQGLRPVFSNSLTLWLAYFVELTVLPFLVFKNKIKFTFNLKLSKH